ncbi:MAG: T9SS type A sorting domain-containing protein [Bacteroidia bacterium]|nr:T9SS type A sorting domain-containing protein [Bacteroidia bacterium]
MNTTINSKKPTSLLLGITFALVNLLALSFDVRSQNFQFLIDNGLVSDSNTNYTLKAGLLRQYFDSLHSSDTSIMPFLPGEKAFKRFKTVMQDRIYNEDAQIGGDLFTATKMGNQLISNNIQPCINSDYPWTLVGPINTHISTLGIIMAIAVHPTNPEKIYAGTQASGLWYTSNGGSSWTNVTDVLNLPALGISWIEFDPANLNDVYFATGAHGHSQMLSYGAGIFKISNNGIPKNIIDFSNPVNNAKDFFVSKFLFHPDNANIMFAISSSTFYKFIKNSQNEWVKTFEKHANEQPNQLIYDKIGSYSSYFLDLEVQKQQNELQIFVSSFKHHNDRPIDKPGSIDLNFMVQSNTQYEFEIDGFDIETGFPKVLTISLFSGNNATSQSIFNQIKDIVNHNNNSNFSVLAETEIDTSTQILYHLLKSKDGFPIFKVSGSNSYVNSTDGFGPIQISGNINASNNCIKCQNGAYQTKIAKAWHIRETNLLNWYPIYSNLPSFNLSRYISLEVSKDDPGILYCMVNKTTAKGTIAYVQIYKSANNGQSFSLVKNQFVGGDNNVPSGNHEFIVSDIDKNIAFIGENVLYKSTNFQSGADFTIITKYHPDFSPSSPLSQTHADIRSIVEFHGNGVEGEHKFFIGHDGGISKSNLRNGIGWPDDLIVSNWININGNLELSQAFGFDIFPQTGDPIIGLQDNGNQRLNGTNWLTKAIGDGASVKVSRSNPNYVYGQVNEKFIKFGTCINDLIPTSSCFSSLILPIKQFQNMPMELDPVDDKNLWAAQTKLYKYNHTGQTIGFPSNSFYLSGDDNIRNDDIRAFDISKSNPNIIFVGINEPAWSHLPYTKRIYKSTNGGSSFADITSNVVINNEEVFRKGSTTSIIINPANPNIVYASINQYLPDDSNPNQGKFRVIKSLDGGNTWADMSTGLSQFPVTCLVFQEGTDEVLFAGTDLGIYRWNKQQQKWECYSNGLPKVIITNLEIDYCRNKLLCSTWGRGIWKADLKVEEEVFEITQSQTWGASTFHNFNTNVTVKSGATLTINGNVTFSTDNWLQIEPGAKVIIDGGKIYNSCNENWEGIHIAGDPQKLQSPTSNQGYLFLKDAEIANADVAVSTTALNANGTIDWSKTGGGIVVAVNTTFKNNKRHVEFMEYKKSNNYSASFTNCVFELNQVCHAPTPTVDCLKNMTMVTAWGVHGIKFIGCEFKNLDGAHNADQANYNRGLGIYTLDATIQVGASIDPITCLPQDRGLFSNLTKGIESVHSPSFTLSGQTNIKHQDFELNDKAIVIENGVGYNVYKNNFNLYVPSNYYNRLASPTDLELGTTGIAGIYTNSASGFLLEQNNFTYPNANHSANEIVAGFVLQNSDGNGGSGNVRLNQLSDAYLGCQTQQNNLALQISCNQFTDNANAINLNPVSNSSNYETPFFGFCDPNNQDIRTDYFNTFYTNLTYDAANYKVAPKTYVVKPGEIDRPDQSKSLNVNVDYCQGIGSVVPKDNCLLTANIQDNCAGTIENPDPNNGNYFSLKTLKSYWQNEVENAGLSGESLDQAKRNLRFYKIESTKARNHVIWAFNMRSVLDSTFNSLDSIIVFLQNETDIDSRKQLIASYYTKGDYGLAIQHLSGLEPSTDKLADFIIYYNLLIHAAANNRNIYSLNSEENAVLETLASGGITSASFSARAILSLTQGKWFDLVIERVLSEENLMKRKLLNEIDSNNIEGLSAQILKVFPNPANNSFNVSVNTVLDNTKIVFKDAVGKTILEQKMPNNKAGMEINTMNLSSGVYFLLLLNQNIVLEVKKLVINH